MPELTDRLSPEELEYAHAALALLQAWDNETERGRRSHDLMGALFDGERRVEPELMLGLLLIAGHLLDEVASAVGTARDEVLRDVERWCDGPWQVV